MEKRLFCTLTLVILALFLAAPSTSQAEIALMDGKLILSGFVKNTTYYRLNGQDREFKKGNLTKEGRYESNHDTNFDFSNFSAYLEALYTIKEDQESTFRIFGGFRTWYEMATSYDDSMARNMYSDDRQQYQFPQKIDDVITELYTDYTSGPWQFRTGKQIVIWGQLDMSRVADVVNPLDLRWGVPGVDTWEEVKQGLWMIRTFYQSQLPGNLLFEFILNPGYYASFKLPYQGTHWGPANFKNDPFSADRDQGFFSYMQNKWFEDEPSRWALDNYEIGGRVQGYTYDIDWTFLVWNAKQDAPGNVNVTRPTLIQPDIRRHQIPETLEKSISINATPPSAVPPRPLQIFLTPSGVWNGSMKWTAPSLKVSMVTRRIYTPMTASTFSALPCRATGTWIYPGLHRS
jgi:hypothetical protein